MNNDLGPTFYKVVKSVAFITHEEETRLVRLWQDHQDEPALKKLILAHTNLAIKAAKRLNHLAPLADLVQEAHMGMVIAASSFDASRDVRFSTYATWGIKSALKEFLKHMSHPVSITGNGGYRLSQIECTRKVLIRQNGAIANDPKLMVSTLATLTQLSEDIIKDVLSILDSRFESKDEVIVGDSNGNSTEIKREDTSSFADPSDLATEVLLDIDEERQNEALRGSIRLLDQRTQTVILGHSGLGDVGVVTFEALSEILGVSRQRVQQIYKAGLAELRKIMSRNPICADLVGA